MYCQAIKNNGEQCTKPAKEKYENLYCTKHKKWLEHEQKHSEVTEKSSVEEKVVTQSKHNEMEIDESGDAIMRGANFLSDRDDVLVYRLMKYYHEKYAGQPSSLVTITKVMEKLNHILSSDNNLIKTNISR